MVRISVSVRVSDRVGVSVSVRVSVSASIRVKHDISRERSDLPDW